MRRRHTTTIGSQPSYTARAARLRPKAIENAEAAFVEAIRIVREQGAKLWELRAVVSLAGLRHHQGRCGEARDLLAPVYGWFTEGLRHARLKRSQSAARRTNGR